MEPRIFYSFILIGVNVINFVSCSAKYDFIADCIFHKDESFQNDHVTFVCGESPNLNLFGTNSHEPKTIQCSNIDREVYTFWPASYNFKDCNLVQFERGFFNHFSYMHRLDISDIGLEELAAKAFPDTNTLKYLIASKNRLTEIPAQLFANLTDILYIDFSNNNIKQIEAFTFAGL